MSALESKSTVCELCFLPVVAPETIAEFAYHSHNGQTGEIPNEIVVGMGQCLVNPGVVTLTYDTVGQVVVESPYVPPVEKVTAPAPEADDWSHVDGDQTP